MDSTPFRIGAGSGFWGDMVDPAVELIERGDIDAIAFDLLAELTMSVLQRAKLRDPGRGHIPDVEPIMRQVLEPARRHGVTVVTNGGGANPPAAGAATARIAIDRGLGDLRIAIIEGDDLTERIAEIRSQGWRFANLESGEEDIDAIADRVVAAHAYLGSDGIVEALTSGVDVVLGGRLADSALYCGPLMHHFGWTFDRDPELVGAALTIGHVLECAGIASGGMSTQWRLSREPWRLGFPLAQVEPDGSALVTKIRDSGGVINEWTAKEHLLYEVHDPTDYRLPDGIVDLSGVEIREDGPDRVRLTGMTGRPRPDLLKVQIGYEAGYIAEGRAMFPWPDALEKATWSEDLVRRRLRHLGVEPLEQRYDRVGIDALAGPVAPPPQHDPNEVELRMVVRCATRPEAESARRALLMPATAGPAGTAFGVPSPVRKVIALWPTLVPRELVHERVTITTARELADAAA
ncbi:MAG TPA: acyclic terpene utilization AtuA family protein [Capillimicrobium sp.]|nr:acyclic terpene utilization AtuA family protein [Capillimicrobium sp.]